MKLTVPKRSRCSIFLRGYHLQGGGQESVKQIKCAIFIIKIIRTKEEGHSGGLFLETINFY